MGKGMYRPGRFFAIAAAAQLALLGGVPARAAETEHFCTIDEVAYYQVRMHFRCHDVMPADPSKGLPAGIRYFAMDPRTDPPFAKVLLDSCQNFIVRLYGGRASWCKLWIRFEADPRANPPGCLAIDCRRIVGIRWLA